MKKNIIGLKELKERALLKRKDELLSNKIKELDTFVELLSSKLINDIEEADNNGLQSIVFLNFWKIRWHYPNEESVEFSSVCNSTSSARNLSQKFVASGHVPTKETFDYFYSVITKPPMFLKTLSTLTSMADKNKALTKSSLLSGNDFGYMFNVLFSEIFFACYTDELVEIKGLGVFEKTLKINAKTRDKKIPVGYLQFFPNFDQE